MAGAETPVVLENEMNRISESCFARDAYNNTLSDYLNHMIKALLRVPIEYIVYGSGRDKMKEQSRGMESEGFDIDLYTTKPISIREYVKNYMIKIFPDALFCYKAAIHPATHRLQIWQRTILDVTLVDELTFQRMYECSDPIPDTKYGRVSGLLIELLECSKLLSRPAYTLNKDPNSMLGDSLKFIKKKKEMELLLKNPPKLPISPTKYSGGSKLGKFNLIISPTNSIHGGMAALCCYEHLLGIKGAVVQIRSNSDKEELLISSNMPLMPVTGFSTAHIADTDIEYKRTYNDILPHATQGAHYFWYNVEKAPPEFIYCQGKILGLTVTMLSPITLLCEFLCLWMSQKLHESPTDTTYTEYYERLLRLLKHEIASHVDIIAPCGNISKIKVASSRTMFFGSDEEIKYLRSLYCFGSPDIKFMVDKQKKMQLDPCLTKQTWSIIVASNQTL